MMKNFIKRSLLLAVVIVACNASGKDAGTKIPIYKEYSNKKELDSTFTKPTVDRDGDRIYISKVTMARESLQLTFFDKDFKVLYKEEVVGKNGVIKTLNVSLLPKGTYRLYIERGINKFTHTVIIE